MQDPELRRVSAVGGKPRDLGNLGTACGEHASQHAGNGHMFRIDPRRDRDPLVAGRVCCDPIDILDHFAEVVGAKVNLSVLDSHRSDTSFNAMVDLRARFDIWMSEHDNPDDPATPAATVLLLRDTPDPSPGVEVLMVQRNAKGTFASNWVFPGGKVDPEDFAGGDDMIVASRIAASREAHEEADVVVSADALVPFSHWMPPKVIPRRFATWFYAAEAPSGADGDVTIDGGEIVDHLWVRPDDALAKHAAGDVQLVPPTWLTLQELSTYDSTADALAAIAASEPDFYVTRQIKAASPTVCWHGDAAYESGDAEAAGPRHRLAMDPDGWTFERTL